MALVTRRFESSSSEAVYKTIFDTATGEGSCDCPGWRFKKGSGPRTCKHVRTMAEDPLFRCELPVAPKELVLTTQTAAAKAMDKGHEGTFIAPMLASALPEGFSPNVGEYVAEEKFDGIRIVLSVGPSVKAWSRNGNARPLPSQVLEAAKRLPDGIYDGEMLAPGKRSYGATELANAGSLVLVLFDVLQVCGRDVCGLPWRERRTFLEAALTGVDEGGGVRLSEVWPVESADRISQLAGAVWERDGEGLVLKRAAAAYRPGKRTKDFLKVKAERSAVFTVVGFKAGLLGAYATVVLKDSDGNETTVKTLNNAERAALEASQGRSGLGRQLRVDYHERTPDGGYRHPMWDRWEDR